MPFISTMELLKNVASCVALLEGLDVLSLVASAFSLPVALLNGLFEQSEVAIN